MPGTAEPGPLADGPARIRSRVGGRRIHRSPRSDNSYSLSSDDSNGLDILVLIQAGRLRRGRAGARAPGMPPPRAPF